MNKDFVTLRIALLFIVIICCYACNKGGGSTITPPKKDKPAIDSTSLYLTSGTWILRKVEYPTTATTWATKSTALGYVTINFGIDKTFAVADNNTVTTTGTWELSGKLLTRKYGATIEKDTITVSSSTLQMVIPQQISVGLQFYDYYRDSYILKQ